MIIITMNPLAPPRSQYVWHQGELFPILPSQVDEVESLLLDGEELNLIRTMDVQGNYGSEKVVTLTGDDAIRVIRLLRLLHPWVDPES